MTVETARLYARELREEDAPRVHALASCPEVAQYMRFSAQETMEGTRALIREYRSGGGPAFLVVEKGTGRVAAVFAFKAADEPHAYSLSHFSTPDLWGKGYGTELLIGMVRYARDVLGAERLYAYIVADNRASCRMVEKCGFRLVQTQYFEDLPGGLCIYICMPDEWEGGDSR